VAFRGAIERIDADVAAEVHSAESGTLLVPWQEIGHELAQPIFMALTSIA